MTGGDKDGGDAWRRVFVSDGTNRKMRRQRSMQRASQGVQGRVVEKYELNIKAPVRNVCLRHLLFFAVHL